jgi:hypothetical protein
MTTLTRTLTTLALVGLLITPASAGDGYTTGDDYARQAERDYRRMEQDARMDRARREQRNQADDQAQALREIQRQQQEILDRLDQPRRSR